MKAAIGNGESVSIGHKQFSAGTQQLLTGLAFLVRIESEHYNELFSITFMFAHQH